MFTRFSLRRMPLPPCEGEVAGEFNDRISKVPQFNPINTSFKLILPSHKNINSVKASTVWTACSRIGFAHEHFRVHFL